MHKQFMTAALQEAYHGRGICAPNPSVGAVAVRDNKLLARAWHKGSGTAHAEHLLLQSLAPGISDVTLYVTLEPCNHWGKTPPCVSAIIEYGIKRVVYGYRDPNPVVMEQDTPRILREKGIEVLYFPMAELAEFYQSYQYWTETKKPWVTAKIAQTLDGKIAGAKGERARLSNDLCGQFTHKQRLHTDIILTTARTIINDSPSLNARFDGVEKSKVLAILDRHLSLPDDASVFLKASYCHIYYDAKLDNIPSRPNCSYHPIAVIDDVLDLKSIIHHIGALGCHDVWVEAGGCLFSALHKQQLVQKTFVYIVPTLLGEEAVQAWYEKDIFQRPHTISWQIQADNVIACLEWTEDECLPV